MGPCGGLRLLLWAFGVLLGARLLLGFGGQAEVWVGSFEGLRLLLRAFGVLLSARLFDLLHCRLRASRLLLRAFMMLLSARPLLITRCRLFDRLR